MPLVEKSDYKPPFLCRNGHSSTIYMGALRSFSEPVYKRFRLALLDGDFLLIDYQVKDPSRAVILCHGLEGSSRSEYNNRAAQYFLKQGYSVFAWNNRSCGGAMNPGIRLYHHGETEDLARVVESVLERGFSEIYLLGYSMGGAQILNYFGRHTIDERIKRGVAVSAPISLASSAKRMERGLSKVYLKRFIKKIRLKVMEKAERFPEILSGEDVRHIKNFEGLAQSFIVPVYGFKSLEDFYQKASPQTYISGINTPILVLNAQDDPIIGPKSYPVKTAENHPYLQLEMPDHGGHCGFPIKGESHAYSESRALDFFRCKT